MDKQDNPLAQIFVEKFIILKTDSAFSLWRFYLGFWDDELYVVQLYLGLWLSDLKFYFYSPYLHTLSPAFYFSRDSISVNHYSASNIFIKTRKWIGTKTALHSLLFILLPEAVFVFQLTTQFKLFVKSCNDNSPFVPRAFSGQIIEVTYFL